MTPGLPEHPRNQGSTYRSLIVWQKSKTPTKVKLDRLLLPCGTVTIVHEVEGVVQVLVNLALEVRELVRAIQNSGLPQKDALDQIVGSSGVRPASNCFPMPLAGLVSMPTM